MKITATLLLIATMAAATALALDYSPNDYKGRLKVNGENGPYTVEVSRFNRNFNDFCNLDRSHVSGWISMETLDKQREQLARVADVREIVEERVRLKIPLSLITRIKLEPPEDPDLAKVALYSPFISGSSAQLTLDVIVPMEEGPALALRGLTLQNASFTDCMGEYLYVLTDDLLTPEDAIHRVTQRIDIRDVTEIEIYEVEEEESAFE